MRNSTLCFLIREGEICLAMKKRGFGEGKWNGVGGKVEEGESIENTALRELEEEVGVKSEARHLRKVGDISFFFLDNPEWDQKTHVYVVREWEGDPKESEEMAPKWYRHHKIPYDTMWIDDIYWLPKVLEGRKIKEEACYPNFLLRNCKF
jgi:8-oxo-dGTP pyrophosphatase MutT (NUDIX family)